MAPTEHRTSDGRPLLLTDAYGWVTDSQWATYRRRNVSPSDAQTIAETLGFAYPSSSGLLHDACEKAAEEYGETMFSEYDFQRATERGGGIPERLIPSFKSTTPFDREESYTPDEVLASVQQAYEDLRQRVEAAGWTGAIDVDYAVDFDPERPNQVIVTATARPVFRVGG